MEIIGDIPAKERYLWIDAQSTEVIIFTKTSTEAAAILGWPKWKVKGWRRNNLVQAEKPAKQYDGFSSKTKSVENYVGERLLDKHHKYQRANSTREPFV